MCRIRRMLVSPPLSSVVTICTYIHTVCELACGVCICTFIPVYCTVVSIMYVKCMYTYIPLYLNSHILYVIQYYIIMFIIRFISVCDRYIQCTNVTHNLTEARDINHRFFFFFFFFFKSIFFNKSI
jgi:hypothetical protein